MTGPDFMNFLQQSVNVAVIKQSPWSLSESITPNGWGFFVYIRSKHQKLALNIKNHYHI